jgi:hypothetical protein
VVNESWHAPEDEAPSTPESQSPSRPVPGSEHTTAYVALIFHGPASEWSSYAESISSDPRIRTVGASVAGGPSCGQCTASSSQPGTSITDSAPRMMWMVGVEGDRYNVHPERESCRAMGCVPV